jgi:DNA-directed RNA polymerase subunit RPC12/RpoP
MCGGEFTDEHHFSKYCKNCKAKIEYTVEMEKVSKVRAESEDWRPFQLSPQFYEIRHKEITMGIKCPECGHEIDVYPGVQDWEIKCDSCKLLFTIDIAVNVTRFA